MTRARMPRPHEVAAAQRDPRLLRALRERDAGPGWRTRGVCRTVDPETFFPAPSEPADAAVTLCRSCAVQGSCLAWALEVGDCHGVWGATTPRERRAMLVAWRGWQATGASPLTRDGQDIDLVPVPAGAGPNRIPTQSRGVPVMPVVPAVPTVPTTPTVRAVPAMPVVPAVPAMPVVPAVPAMPVVPAVPDVPDVGLGFVDEALAARFDTALADELIDLEELVEHAPA